MIKYLAGVSLPSQTTIKKGKTELNKIYFLYNINIILTLVYNTKYVVVAYESKQYNKGVGIYDF